MKILNMLLFVILFSTAVIAQWKRTNGPEGMSIYSLASYDGIIYAGTRTDGIYASSDEGINWYPLNNGIETNWIRTIVSSNDTLLAGTFYDGIFYSTDGGQTWNPNPVYNNGNVTSMIVKDQYVFAGTYAGLLRSSDNGFTWEVLPSYFFEIPSEMCIVGDKLIAGSLFHSYVSEDNGETWTEIASLEGADVYSVYAEGDTVFAGARNEVYRSIDQGNTFFSIDLPFEFDVVNVYSITAIGQTLFIATSYDGVYKSTDNGLTWISANNGMGGNNVRALTLTQTSNLIAGLHYSGIYRSVDNGENWNKSMAGIPAGSTISKLINSELGIFAGTRDGVYKTTDNGNTWERLTGDNDTINNATVRGIAVKDRDIFVALTYNFNGLIYKSTDAGDTWERSDNGFPSDITFMFSVVFSGNNVVAGASGGVYYSTDNGESWQLSNLTSGSVIDMAVTKDYVYAVLQLGGVYRSSDDGVTWSSFFNPPSIFFTGFTALDNIAYTSAFDVGVWVTTDGGNVWLPAGFPQGESAFDVEVIPAEPGMALAGTNIEPNNFIYASFNYSHTFVPYSEGLGIHAVAEAFTSNDKYSFAGTSYNGVWRRTLPGVTAVINNESDLPQNFSLEQNYPNPFNPTTTIVYSIPQSGYVELIVFNALGEQISTLVSEPKDAGKYEVEFNAVNMTSGIYYYQIKTAEFVQTKKMILLR